MNDRKEESLKEVMGQGLGKTKKHLHKQYKKNIKTAHNLILSIKETNFLKSSKKNNKV